MATIGKTRVAGSRGMVSVLALIFLVIFASLSVAYCTSINQNVIQSANFSHVTDARLAAESGLGFLIGEMKLCGVSGSLRGQALLDKLAAKLKTRMNGTGNLGANTIGYDGTANHTGTTITVPAISIDGGRNFTGKITLTAADTLHLVVTGQAAGATTTTVQRQVSIDIHPQWDQALGYGMCSKGPVEMAMNNNFVGLDNTLDGSIYSAAPGMAVSCGSGTISGNVSMSDPSAWPSLTGVHVGGSIIQNAPPVTMPTIDRSGYKALATTVVDSSTNFSSGTFKNIRIKANTNPVFGSVTIQGIMYIEAPNNIQFTNNVNFTGVMVADDPPTGSPDTANYIYFKNNMTFDDVTALPSDFPNRAALQAFKDAEILAPGFTMEFKNNMSSVGGLVALKALTVKNNETSTVYGSLLIYGDAGVSFKNNDGLTISLSSSTPPPGFKGYGLSPLVADATTYVEQ